MKYRVKTKIENGFEKIDIRRNPNDRRKTLYLVIDENNKTQEVDKKWIISNVNNIVNICVSGNGLYLIPSVRNEEVQNKKREIPYVVVSRVGHYKFPNAEDSIRKAFVLEKQGYRIIVNDEVMSAEKFQLKCKNELSVPSIPGGCHIRFYQDVSEYIDKKNKAFYCKLGVIRVENLI